MKHRSKPTKYKVCKNSKFEYRNSKQIRITKIQMSESGKNPERLFLLDGTALAYRSYFAFIRNPLINSKGVNTSGIFGFTNTLMKILREERPDYIACVFDTSAPTFRHKTFPDYKATRQKMPDELVDQLPTIREILEAFRIPLVEVDGYEADDVMGTLAKQAEERGMETFLVTGDKDFMQLLTDRVKMYVLSRGGSGSEVEILGPEGVVEKLGVGPERVTDLLGLMGDSSDNVPGVPGIGPKTARELVGAFGSLEGVLDRVEEVKRPRIRENLMIHKDQAVLSKELVTIHLDVPVEVTVSNLRTEELDREKVVTLFHELEFNRFLQELSGVIGQKRGVPDRKYRSITMSGDLEKLGEELKGVSMFAIDLETTSLDPISAEIVGFSFSWNEGEATYVPVKLRDEDRSGDLFDTSEGGVLDTVLKELKPVLEDPGIRKCGQNIKYDMLVLRRHGIDLGGVDFDSMVAAYLINPSARQFGIDALALEYLNIKKIPTKSLIGVGKKQISMAEVDLEKVVEYGCEDADVAYQLRGVLEPKLKESQMDRLFREVEMPLVRVLVEMEENGVALDKKLLSKMSEEMESQLDQLREEIYGIAGENFNINSTQQLGKILFEKLKVHELLGLRRPRRTKTGYATDMKVLESLSIHPLPRRLLDYRQLMKLRSTYVDALPNLINSATNRVHASFNQTATATGRLSTSDPNLQNIPIRTDLGKEIRRAFIAGQEGWVLLSADYSQIELRIMAHLSGDETLVESFLKGEDVHLRTALEIFDIREKDVTDEHRRQAKMINFGIMYGMGAYGLAQRLGISHEEAGNFISAYFARYPKVNEFIAQTIGHAHQKGYVTTLLKRRRFLPELRSDNRNVREFGERTAINTPIQGTAADLIKVAMIRIAEHLRKGRWKAKMILQIHDELVFDVPSNEVEKLSEMVRREMEGAIALSVPIKVDIGVGKNWFEAH
jgi:DNA polymerase-1